MTAVIALVVVAVLTDRERRRRPRDAPPGWWPWLIGVIEQRAARRLDDLPSATVAACLHGPPELRDAARAAVREGPPTAPPSLIAALRDDVATARGDRLFGTVAAIEARGVDADGPLARLRAVEVLVSADERACRAVVVAGAVARWLLLTPLLLVAGGPLQGPPAQLVAVVTVGAWWLAAAWVRPPPQVRVFADEPIGGRR